jgi:hypothetical protein
LRREKVEGCLVILLLIFFYLIFRFILGYIEQSKPKYYSYNDPSGFSFDYSSSWRKLKKSEMEGLGVGDAKVAFLSEKTGSLIVVRMEGPVELRMDEDFMNKEAAAAIDFLKESDPSFKLEKKYLRKDGAGFEVRFRGVDSEGKNYRALLVVYYREDKRLGFLLMSPPSQFSKEEVHLREMIKSLSVLPG